MIKQFFVRWLICIMVLPGIVHAQAQLVPSAMQRAISGVTQSKMASRGFASNDPRWGATLQANGSMIAGGAAAAAVVTAAGITAPAWVTVAATLALGALLSAGINLAIDGIKWLFNNDGSISTEGGGSGPSLLPGQCFMDVRGGGGCYASISDLLTGRSEAPPSNTNQYGTYTYAYGPVQCEPLPGWCSMKIIGHLTRPSGGPAETFDHSTYSKPVKIGEGTSLPLLTPDVFDGGGMTPKSPTAAAGGLSDGDKGKPLNPLLLAAIADQAWKNAAAQPGYDGYPYDPANPITEADAAAWRNANPQSWPTVGDAVAPQPSPSSGPSSGTSPWTLPNNAANPVTNPGTDSPPPETPSTFD